MFVMKLSKKNFQQIVKEIIDSCLEEDVRVSNAGKMLRQVHMELQKEKDPNKIKKLQAKKNALMVSIATGSPIPSEYNVSESNKAMSDIDLDIHRDSIKMSLINAIDNDRKLKQEILANMEAESDPKELKIYKRALYIINNTLEEKEALLRTLNPKKQYESLLNEKAPPGMEDWIKSNKKRFLKQYGKENGMKILYATAWKMYNKKD